jgi:2'-5' RNA ligase
MAESARLFIAIAPPRALRQSLFGLAQRLHAEAGGKIVPASNLHLTLAFLGQTNLARAPDILETFADWPVNLPPLSLDRIGSFSSARVVWAGCSAMVPDWNAAITGLQQRLRKQHIAFDDKPWRAHVTLLRKTTLPDQALDRPLVWHAGAPQLFVSESGERGPVYRVLGMV